MQNISSDLNDEIKSASQRVLPRVTVQWANNRILDNLKVVSTSDSWYLSSIDVQDVAPDVYWRLNDQSSATFSIDYSKHGFNGIISAGASKFQSSTPLIGDSTSRSFLNSGSNGFVYYTSIKACSLNSVNATIEGWFKSSSVSAQGLFCNYGGGNEVKVSTNSSGELNMSITGTLSQTTSVLTDGVWHHVALVKWGDTWTLYFDGASVATQTKAISGGFTTVRVGANSTTNFNGNYCEFVSSPRIKDAIEISIRYRQISASIYNIFFTSKELFNGNLHQTFSWAVCGGVDEFNQPIRANGKFYALPDTSNGQYEFGFRSSRTATTAYGVGKGQLPTYPDKVYARFDVRHANKINVFLPDEYGSAEKLESLSYIDTSGSLVDASSFNTNLNLPDRKNVFVLSADGSEVELKGLVVTFDKAKFYGDSVNIQEIEISFEEDISEYVISSDIDKVRENYDSSVPLGATASNSLSLSLSNVDGKFNKYNNASKISRYIDRDIKINIELGWLVP